MFDNERIKKSKQQMNKQNKLTDRQQNGGFQRVRVGGGRRG